MLKEIILQILLVSFRATWRFSVAQSKMWNRLKKISAEARLKGSIGELTLQQWLLSNGAGPTSPLQVLWPLRYGLMASLSCWRSCWARFQWAALWPHCQVALPLHLRALSKGRPGANCLFPSSPPSPSGQFYPEFNSYFCHRFHVWFGASHFLSAVHQYNGDDNTSFLQPFVCLVRLGCKQFSAGTVSCYRALWVLAQ